MRMKYAVPEKTYIMEKRNANGRLTMIDPQPPFLLCTERQVFDHWFQQNPEGGDTVSQEAVWDWYKAQGFYIRPKAW